MVAVRWKPVALVVLVLLGASCGGCICGASCPPSCTVETLFVSPAVDGVIEARLIAILDAATRTVDLTLYSFTDDQLGDAVIRAHQRGVLIRVIRDGAQSAGSGDENDQLRGAGIEVIVENLRGSMHHKFLVVDGTITVTGSYNWSDAADQSNFENVVVIVCAEVADDFTAEFNRIWNALKAGQTP